MEGAVEAALGGARPAVGPADRRLEPVAQGALVAGQVPQLDVVDGGRRAEELLAWNAGQVGQDLVGAGGIRHGLAVEHDLHGALGAAEVLLHAPRADPVEVLLDELDGDPGAAVLAGPPAAERLDLGAARRRLAEEGDLEGTLDGRLAALVRPADDGQAGRQLEIEVAVGLEVPEPEPGDPHRVTSRPSRRSRAIRSASRTSRASASRPAAAAAAL